MCFEWTWMFVADKSLSKTDKMPDQTYLHNKVYSLSHLFEGLFRVKGSHMR